jgi:hypothetical protein
VQPAKAEEVITASGSALLNRRRVNMTRFLHSASPAETLRALSMQSTFGIRNAFPCGQ